MTEHSQNNRHDQQKTDLDKEDVAALASTLSNNVIKETKPPPVSQLTKHVQKEQQANEFTRLGVHGVLSMLLSVFAPLFMKINQARTSTHHIKREVDNDK